MERMAARAGVRIKSGLEAGGHINNGALREALVLVREISSGNWTRVPGSVSILLSRLGFLKYLFSAVGVAAIAAGAGVYYFWQYLKKTNEELDNTGNIFARGWGKMADSFQSSTKGAAEAAADFNDWLRKLGESQETLADKTAETIKAMREESSLRRQATGDTSKESEQIERKAELEVVAKALLEQRRIAENAAAEASKANADAFTSPDAIRRHAIIGSGENHKQDIDFYSAAQRALQDDVDKAVKEYRLVGTRAEQGQLKQNVFNHESEITRDVEVNGKKYSLSLRQASELLDKSMSAQRALETQQARLAEVQRELADLAKDTKTNAEKQKTARERLQSEESELQKSISLHDKYDPEIAARGGKLSHGHVSSLQQVGAYTSGAIDIGKQQLKHLASIDKKLSSRQASGQHTKY